MFDFFMKCGVMFCFVFVIGLGLIFVDDFLGYCDNISIGLNQWQKVEMKVLLGFVEGLMLNGFICNYYFVCDNYDILFCCDQCEWVQGLMLLFCFGYIDMLIGIGLDVYVFYGLCLDGGGGSGGVGVLLLDFVGCFVDSFLVVGVVFKLCGLDSLLKIGDQLLENLVIVSGVSCMVLQSYCGVILKNYYFCVFELDVGFVEVICLCNQSGYSYFISGYGNGIKGGIVVDCESLYIVWLGVSYSVFGGSQVMFYSGCLEDIWNQYYFGFSQLWWFFS